MKCFGIPVNDNYSARIYDFLLIYFTADVDLYASDEKLWGLIFFKVNTWSMSQTDTSLHKAARLLHKTKTRKFRHKLTKSPVLSKTISNCSCHNQT
jgi:hypothetical protein